MTSATWRKSVVQPLDSLCTYAGISQKGHEYVELYEHIIKHVEANGLSGYTSEVARTNCRYPKDISGDRLERLIKKLL